jgi:hypothetical protein
MTSIRSGAPRVATTVPTSSTQASSPTTASSSSAQTGSPAASSFQAATAAPTKAQQSVTDAKSVLDSLPAGADRDAIAVVLNKPMPTSKELKAAEEAMKRLADSGDLTQEKYDKLSKGISYRSVMSSMVKNMLSQMEQYIKQLEEKSRSKQQ